MNLSSQNEIDAQETTAPLDDIVKNETKYTGKFSIDIKDLLDPDKFCIGSASPKTKHRVTKEHFVHPPGTVNELDLESTDPLSQLDPLWLVKK